jgi:hypothetical protein
MVLKQRGGQQGPRRKLQPSRNITVTRILPRGWLERERLRVAPKTYASYAETVNRYIVKPGVGIGALRVRDVERGDIETMLDQAGT